MTARTKIYFASDLHLGTPDFETSLRRERLFVAWLDTVSADAAEIFLVGDTFDFWHDYKTVVPKGHVRLLGKLAELSDSGIKLHIFTGNHDLWFDGYFEKELGAHVYSAPIERTFDGKLFFIGHGDGLGPKDYGYKFIKKVFTNPICQWLFKWIHPDLGIRLAAYLSYRSRYSNGKHELEQFLGEDREWLVQYCKRLLERKPYDYFIFGHRHLPLDIEIRGEGRVTGGEGSTTNLTPITPRPSRRSVRDCKPEGGFNSHRTNVFKPPSVGLGVKHAGIHADLYTPVDEGQVHYINLGDWIDYQSYAEWDGRKLELKYYRKDQ